MTSPRVLLKAWNIPAKKQLGQNFLTDPAAAEKIIKAAAIEPTDTVLEIGAGLGALTIPAAKAAHRILAVETDDRIFQLLKTELLAHQIANVDIVKQNILNLNLADLRKDYTDSWVVLGNLPYHISSQILFWLIDNKQMVSRAVLMFQKELAERIASPPGNKAYGRISVMAQYCADIQKLLDIKPTHFFPRPKVDSSVLGLKFHQPPKFPAKNEQMLFRLVKAAFSKRRKTIKNALKSGGVNLNQEQVLTILEAARIDPVRRAETLSVEEFVRLSNCL